MARPPLSCVSWFRVSRWRYQNRNRLATTPAIRIRLLLLCAFCGVRLVLGLITDGSWCWGTAALAPCFLIRCAGVLAMAPLSPVLTSRQARAGPGLRTAACSLPVRADRLERVTELGKHRLGRHSTAELNPALDDYQLAEALVREAGTPGAAHAAGRAGRPAKDVRFRRRHRRGPRRRGLRARTAPALPARRRHPRRGGRVRGGQQRPDLGDRPRRRDLQLPARLHLLVLRHCPQGLLRCACSARSSSRRRTSSGSAEQHRPATLNGERLTTFGPDGGPGAGRSDTPLSELGAATYIHPTWLADPLCAMPWHAAATSAAALRMFGSGSCDLEPGGRRRTGLLVPAQLPGMGLAAGQSDRPRGRRRRRRRPGQRAGLVRRRRHDGGPAAPRRPGIRLRGVDPGAQHPAPLGHAQSSLRAPRDMLIVGRGAWACGHLSSVRGRGGHVPRGRTPVSVAPPRLVRHHGYVV